MQLRKNSVETLLFQNQGSDISSLFLRTPDSLTKEEIMLLKQFYNDNGREMIEKESVRQKILPFVADVLASINCDQKYWSDRHELYVERNEKIIEMLDSVFLEMQSYGCKTLALTENFGVVLQSQSCIGCFCSGDIDLYADIFEKEQIISCMNSLNFTHQTRTIGKRENSEQSTMFFNGEIIPGGFWIQIVWKPVARAFFYQKKYEARLLNERLLANQIAGTKIRVLNETALMYFCALHISAGHYYTLSPGLRLYVDIDRLARGSDVNWDELMKWGIEDEAGIRIATVMYICHKLLKTPIPKRVYQEALKNKRNSRLVNYLYNTKTNQIQNKSSKLRRLYIELASDNKNLVYAIKGRLNQQYFINS
jgi:hypothetical protein